MESKSIWKRDIFLIPLVIGVVVAVVTYLLPKFFDTEKRLSYTIDGPTAYVNPTASGVVKIAVNGVETTNIFGYKLRIWNSGSLPLMALPVRFVFEPVSSNFHIFNVTHDTIPKRDFGRIEESGSDASSKRFVYELLNPNDEDTLMFVTDVGAPLSVFAKAEGLKTKLVNPESPTMKALLFSMQVVAVLTSIVSSVLTLLMLQAAIRRKTSINRRL